MRSVSFNQQCMERALRNLEAKVEESKGDAFLRSMKALNKGCMRIIYIVVSFYLFFNPCGKGMPGLLTVVVIRGNKLKIVI